jgi:hypothetical protein
VIAGTDCMVFVSPKKLAKMAFWNSKYRYFFLKNGSYFFKKKAIFSPKIGNSSVE